MFSACLYCTQSLLSLAGAPCENLPDMPAVDLSPKFVGSLDSISDGMQPCAGMHCVRKWHCPGEVERRGRVFQEMLISHPALPWVSQQEVTHFWKLIHELSIEEVKERAELSELVGSLVLSYAVSHYFVFHCYPHAVSVFIILNSTALTLVLSDLLTHSSTKSLLRAPCLQDLGCAGEQARPECLLL